MDRSSAASNSFDPLACADIAGDAVNQYLARSELRSHVVNFLPRVADATISRSDLLEELPRALAHLHAPMLQVLLQGDFFKADRDGSENANGTESHIEARLGVYPRLPIEEMRRIDPQSPHILADILDHCTGIVTDHARPGVAEVLDPHHPILKLARSILSAHRRP